MKAVAPASAGPVGRLKPAVGAFTLIELLVVIGIMLLLMGLVLGSVTRGPRLQGMIAAEQMIADVVRQARHTARSSGQPVVLHLRKDERRIGGLTRQILWQALEGWPTVHDGGTPGAQLDAPGRTGTGLMLPEALLRDGKLPPPIDIDPDRVRLPNVMPVASRDPLTGGNRLWRGQAAPDPRPTLLLSVAVLPPTADVGAPALLPLAMVAGEDEARPGDLTTAPLGLALVLSTETPVSPSAPQATKAGTTKTVPTWEIVGWCGAGTERVEVSSLSHAPPDQVSRRAADAPTLIIKGAPSGDVSEHSEPWALLGGRWTEISLLAEGERLVLYRDGRRVGELKLPAPATFPTPAVERVYVGIATRDDGGRTLAETCIIDDVRLERLGDALAGNLPGGIAPDQDRRITCHPDGRVEVDAPGDAAVADDTRIILKANGGGEEAELTITTAGAVSSRTRTEAEP